MSHLINNLVDRRNNESYRSDRRVDHYYNKTEAPVREFLSKMNIFTADEVNLMINSILTDKHCKKIITSGYEMKDLEKTAMFDFEKERTPSYRMENTPKDDKAVKNIRNRFLHKTEETSYEKPEGFKNRPDHEEKSIAAMKKVDTRDAALDQIMGFAVTDLLQDILSKKAVRLKGVKNIKVYKTPQYDKVIGMTDFIIEVENEKNKEYGAYDLIPSNSDKINKERRNAREVICPYFKTIHNLKLIPRSIISINNEDILFKYLKKYMEEVIKTGKMPAKKAEELFQSIQTNDKDIREELIKQLFKTELLN